MLRLHLSRLTCCLLATAGLNVATSGRLAQAQEEPIAVAAPVTADQSDSKPDSAATSAPATKLEAADASGQLSSAARVRPLTVSVQLLRSDLNITGALTDSTLLSLKTAFGEASIPLSEVAGVRFPSGQDTSTTLVMLNGDSITGASDVKTVTVETEWGTAKINGENISSMLFVPGLQWQSVSGLNGARWTLTEAKAQPTSPSLPGSSPTGSSPISSVSGSGNPVPGLPAPVSSSSSSNIPRVVFPR